MSRQEDPGREDPFHVGLLQQMAKVVGWERLRKLVDRLAAQDAEKEKRTR